MRKFILSVVTIVTAVATFFALNHFLPPTSQVKEAAESESTPTETASPTPPAEEIDTSSSSDNPDGKTPEHYDGDDPNTSDNLTGSISAARFSSDESTLIVRVNIDQYLTAGSCRLEIFDEEGTVVVEKAVEITPEAATSTCAGFDVPTSELPSAHHPITVKINLSSGDKIGSLTTLVE